MFDNYKIDENKKNFSDIFEIIDKNVNGNESSELT